MQTCDQPQKDAARSQKKEIPPPLSCVGWGFFPLSIKSCKETQ